MTTIASYTGSHFLYTFRQRLTQINLDAFTTGQYAYNRGSLSSHRAFAYLCEIMESGGTAFLAFDDGNRASPEYPVGFLFSRSLSQDSFLNMSNLASRVPPTTSYLAEMAVDGAHRGTGIGQSLVKSYLEFAKKNGSSHSAVRTNESDAKARNFYRKCGYAETEIVIHPSGYGAKRYFIIEFA